MFRSASRPEQEVRKEELDLQQRHIPPDRLDHLAIGVQRAGRMRQDPFGRQSI